MLLRFLFIVCLLASCVAGSSAWASDYEVERRLLRIDHTEATDINAALNSQNWRVVKDFGVHGYDDGVYWLQLTIKSKRHTTQDLVVRNLYALHDLVDFYLYDGKQLLQHWAMGDARKNPGWVFPDKNFTIPLELTANSERQVFIRIEGMNTKMLKTSVISHSEMQESNHWSRLIFGAIYGIMMFMGLYNLIIGVFVKDKAYVLYACQVILFCIYIMTINGDGRYYLWRESAAFNQYAIQFFGVLYVFFLILFPWYLLKLNRYLPNAKYLFYFLWMVEILFAIAVLTQPAYLSMQISVAVSMLFSPILFFVGLYLVFRKVPLSGIYTFAWSFYLMGATFVGLAAANIIEMNIFTLNGSAIGGIVEQALLSIALAKRIHIARQEKYAALQIASASEVEAEKHRQNFQKIFERAPVGMVTLNENGDVTSINPKCCELFGFTHPDQINHLKIKFYERFSTAQKIKKHALNDGEIVDHETVVITQSGEKKHCNITLIKQIDDNETIYEGYITDISERKKAQEILKIVEEEKISSLEQLVTGVAHEINTPLGVNLTSISFVKDELKEVDKKLNEGSITKGALQEYVKSSLNAFDLMDKSLQKISTLVRSFKQVSFKHVTPVKQTISVKEYIDEVVKEALGDKSNINIKLYVESGDSLELYPDLLDIILKQLIENSLVHGFENKDDGEISLKVINKDQRIIMEYRDNGVGVDEKIRKQIFNPFVTSNRGSINHSGLGLYRIHNLVAQVLKGEIQLLDESGFAIRIEFEL